MSTPQPISVMPAQAPQSLPVGGHEVDPRDPQRDAGPEPVRIAQESSEAAAGLASLEQNAGPAAGWNRSAARFGSAGQFLGTSRSEPSQATHVLTDEVLDDLALISAVNPDDPSVDLTEIDAALERLLNNPNVLTLLEESEPGDLVEFLGITDPDAPSQLAALREELQIRRLTQDALGDRGAAVQDGDYEEILRIDGARASLRRHPFASRMLAQILASDAPEAADLAASIVIQHPELIPRFEELLMDEDVDRSARARGVVILPRIAQEVPELRENIRAFLGERQRTEGDPHVRAEALMAHHRLGFRSYGEAVELVGSLAWTLRNDTDPALRVSAVYHLAQVAREISSGSSYPDHYPVELEEGSQRESLVLYIRRDVLEDALWDISPPPADVEDAINESLGSMP